MTRYSSTMTEALQEIREGFSTKQIKMAIGIASDKRYAGGNMTGAVKAIEKIKRGLSDHPQVRAVLQRQNEELEEALPPHLAKLFDKDGNFKDPKKQKVFDRMMGDGIGKEIAQKMGRIKFRVQADSAKKKVMVYVDQNDESDAQKALKNHPAYVSGALRVIPEGTELEEKLGKDADAGDYIDDFKKSDAPQFKGKSDKKKKDMAIAAYLDAKDKNESKVLDNMSQLPKGMERPLKSMQQVKKDADLGGMKITHIVKNKQGNKVVAAVVSNGKKNFVYVNNRGVAPLKEEDEKKMDKPDSAKMVDQGREDKKKTRIAQLQLQIAKAQETINKLNAQEKPNG